MLVRPLLSCLLLLITVGACRHHPKGVVSVSGYELDAARWEDTMGELGARAAFELACPYAYLSFSVLRNGEGKRVDGIREDEASQVGVEGCGRRALYMRLIMGSISRWLLQGSVGTTAGGYDPAMAPVFAPPAPPPPPYQPPPYQPPPVYPPPGAR